MEGEMIVKEDVEHVPAPVMLSSSGGTMRRVPSHPTDQPGHDIPGRITERRARGDRRDGAAIEPEGPARPRIPITSVDQSRRIGH